MQSACYVLRNQKGSQTIFNFFGEAHFMHRYKLCFAAIMGMAAAIAPAQAATVFLNNGAPYAEVVHANSAGSGTTLNTLTKPGAIPVALSSVDGLDVGNGDGVAIVKGLGSGNGNGFSALLIDPSTGFSVMQFKIEDFANQRARNLNIKVNFVGGGSQVFSGFGLPSNSKIDVMAGASEVLDSIELYGLVNQAGGSLKFKDVKQISFDPVMSGIPEPASWAMMLAGFGLVGGAARRRRSGAALISA